MKQLKNIIGAFDAKTHLSQILENVQNGDEVTITKRGKPIARIIPYRETESISKKQIITEFANIRNSIDEKVNIKDYINEGRKY